MGYSERARPLRLSAVMRRRRVYKRSVCGAVFTLELLKVVNTVSRLSESAVPVPLRIATFNASLNRDGAGELVADLRGGDLQQARRVAQIIQNVGPDILVLQEFDYDADGTALKLFQDNYLAISQGSSPGLRFPYALA